MMSTPSVISSVPRIAFSRPPSSAPKVLVVSTLHWKFGIARYSTPPTSQSVGTTIAASARKQSAQKTAL